MLYEIGNYFVCLYAYNRGKGSYNIYYSDIKKFRKLLKQLEMKLSKVGYEIYRVSKAQKTALGLLRRRVYFRRCMV